MTSARLPVVRGDALDAVEIASPCTVPWEQMKGGPVVRHCGVCRQDVFNVSAMNRDEALALLARAQGRACVRLMRRRDGTVITADCWSRLRAARRRGLLAALATLVVMLPIFVVAAIQGARHLREALLPKVDELQTTLLMGMVPPPPKGTGDLSPGGR